MNHTKLIQIIVAIAGAFYTFVGAALIAAPGWFFENIGPFAPFNRHYMGDLGSFTIAMGLGLLLAARDPLKHKLFLGVVLLGSTLHTLNHAYDAITGRVTLAHAISDVLPLLLFAIIFALVFIQPKQLAAAR